jgi:hypothetical protein
VCMSKRRNDNAGGDSRKTFSKRRKGGEDSPLRLTPHSTKPINFAFTSWFANAEEMLVPSDTTTPWWEPPRKAVEKEVASIPQLHFSAAQYVSSFKSRLLNTHRLVQSRCAVLPRIVVNAWPGFNNRVVSEWVMQHVTSVLKPYYIEVSGLLLTALDDLSKNTSVITRSITPESNLAAFEMVDKADTSFADLLSGTFAARVLSKSVTVLIGPSGSGKHCWLQHIFDASHFGLRLKVWNVSTLQTITAADIMSSITAWLSAPDLKDNGHSVDVDLAPMLIENLEEVFDADVLGEKSDRLALCDFFINLFQTFTSDASNRPRLELRRIVYVTVGNTDSYEIRKICKSIQRSNASAVTRCFSHLIAPSKMRHWLLALQSPAHASIFRPEWSHLAQVVASQNVSALTRAIDFAEATVPPDSTPRLLLGQVNFGVLTGGVVTNLESHRGFLALVRNIMLPVERPRVKLLQSVVLNPTNPKPVCEKSMPGEEECTLDSSSSSTMRLAFDENWKEMTRRSSRRDEAWETLATHMPAHRAIDFMWKTLSSWLTFRSDGPCQLDTLRLLNEQYQCMLFADTRYPFDSGHAKDVLSTATIDSFFRAHTFNRTVAVEWGSSDTYRVHHLTTASTTTSLDSDDAFYAPRFAVPETARELPFEVAARLQNDIRELKEYLEHKIRA